MTHAEFKSKYFKHLHPSCDLAPRVNYKPVADYFDQILKEDPNYSILVVYPHAVYIQNTDPSKEMTDKIHKHELRFKEILSQ